MDAQEKLVFESDICVGVLGRGGEFVLVPLTGEIDGAITADALAKGYSYCGCLGVTASGEPGVRCEPSPEAASVMVLAALAFAQQIADRLRPPQKGDGAEWLTRLFLLPDMRAN
jgi:hypothetical protein